MIQHSRFMLHLATILNILSHCESIKITFGPVFDENWNIFHPF